MFSLSGTFTLYSLPVSRRTRVVFWSFGPVRPGTTSGQGGRKEISGSKAKARAANDRSILPSEAAFETLAGFLLFQVGHIPKLKESIDYGGSRFAITHMERNRIATVLIEKLKPKSRPIP